LNDATDQADCHYRFARLAVDKAKLCPVNADAPNPPPRVAIVIARGDVILGWEFRTRWVNRGPGSIHALDYDHNVCLAKICSEFDQVDDPGRWLED
jgi:hypothetical protein